MHFATILCPILTLFGILCLWHLDTVDAVKAPPYGRLAVSGRNLIKAKTKEHVALHGISLYWSQWLPRFWVPETINRLACGCNANVVRAAMGTQRSFGGYVADPVGQYKLVKTVIDAALDQGIYVIVDWHTGDDWPTQEIKYAIEFFTKIAQTYGANPHILYEIWNEPNNKPNEKATWEGVIKPYAKTIIDTIRKYDKKNVIIVGTPTWDTDGIMDAAQSPLNGTGYSNIAYTLHFYSGYHTTPTNSGLRDLTQKAYDMGLPIFVTEYGLSSKSNDPWGPLQDLPIWHALLDRLEISYTNWAATDISDQSDSTSSMFQPTGLAIADICKPGFLTPFGNYIYNKLRSQNNRVKWC